ncbi:hypothetical protein, partial [Streptomyces sp. NPDC059744]|uniref:hypothetical protein n=1 Tax=Streptomyces sp. NPDC059744 TaxID=3346929 RepID=UPI0036573A64
MSLCDAVRQYGPERAPVPGGGGVAGGGGVRGGRAPGAGGGRALARLRRILRAVRASLAAFEGLYAE